jgi:haloalkane dehalogenase
MIDVQEISAKFPYQSHFAEIAGVNIHYVDEGEGQPFLLLHGVPTSSYLWRNVIPSLTPVGRVIAPDLVGFGRSGKPDIAYTVFEHIAYIEKFIEQCQLKNIILVLHGWGSVIGFEYFRRHPDNVAGIVFMESHFRAPKGWETISLPIQELASILASSDGGYDVIMNSNYFINKVLPSGVMRRLTNEEMANYSEPFQIPGSAKPIWQYLQELPLGDGPENIMQLIKTYSKELEASNVPKLLLYAIPGYLTTIASIEWAKQNLKNIKIVDIGEGLHYLQETNPFIIGDEIKEWYGDLQTRD